MERGWVLKVPDSLEGRDHAIILARAGQAVGNPALKPANMYFIFSCLLTRSPNTRAVVEVVVVVVVVVAAAAAAVVVVVLMWFLLLLSLLLVTTLPLLLSAPAAAASSSSAAVFLQQGSTRLSHGRRVEQCAYFPASHQNHRPAATQPSKRTSRMLVFHVRDSRRRRFFFCPPPRPCMR